MEFSEDRDAGSAVSERQKGRLGNRDFVHYEAVECGDAWPNPLRWAPPASQSNGGWSIVTTLYSIWIYNSNDRAARRSIVSNKESSGPFGRGQVRRVAETLPNGPIFRKSAVLLLDWDMREEYYKSH